MILMGSNYFFKDYKDFKSHDIDFIDIIERIGNFLNAQT